MLIDLSQFELRDIDDDHLIHGLTMIVEWRSDACGYSSVKPVERPAAPLTLLHPLQSRNGEINGVVPIAVC